MPFPGWVQFCMNDQLEQFEEEVRRNIASLGADTDLQGLSKIWIREITRHKYAYNFSWMGRPLIQFPQDMVALQEIVWKTQPDLIVETGVAHGGSLIYEASLLELLGGDGLVVGIDIDIRPHNRTEIENHPMFKRIRLIEGSSIDETTPDQVRELASGRERVLVLLDSNHTHDHVLQELQIYSPLVRTGGYLTVYDTIIEDTPPELLNPDRPWSVGNNPKTAVHEFLKSNSRFEIDRSIHEKLLITVAPDGYLKCVADPEV